MSNSITTASVAIVLLNWNGWRDTCDCLDSLARLDYAGYTVIVVDNGSTDGSEDEIRRFLSFRTDQWIEIGSQMNVEFIQAGNNGGFAKGNNIGISRALAGGAEYVWVLNNDTEVDPKALSTAVERMKSNPSAGACGSVLIYFDDRARVQAIGGVQYNLYRAMGKQVGEGVNPSIENLESILRNHELSYIAGAAMLLRRDMLLQVGLMYEDYFLYFEEIDWFTRAKKLGWHLIVETTSLVFHKEGASIGTSTRSRRSKLSQYYLSRNLIHFYKRFHPHLMPVAVLRLCREMCQLYLANEKELVKVTRNALVDGLFGKKGKAVL